MIPMSDTATLPEVDVGLDEPPTLFRGYNVILLNDDDHSFDYVIRMLKQLFGYPESTGFRMAQEVDETGRVIVCTTSLERAELKRDQIHAFGPDKTIARCKGSMSADIEPASE